MSFGERVAQSEMLGVAMQRYLRIQRDGFPEFVNNYFSELDASDSTKKAYIERIYHVLSDFCSSID